MGRAWKEYGGANQLCREVATVVGWWLPAPAATEVSRVPIRPQSNMGQLWYEPPLCGSVAVHLHGVTTSRIVCYSMYGFIIKSFVM